MSTILGFALEPGLYALLSGATQGQQPTLAKFSAGVRRYAGPYVGITLAIGVVMVMLWVAVVYGWAFCTAIPLRTLLKDPRWVTYGPPGLSWIVSVSFLYALPFIFVDDKPMVLDPLGGALHFLCTHWGVSWPVVVFTIGRALVEFMSYGTLTQLGLSSLSAVLFRAPLEVFGSAVTFMMAVFILRDHPQAMIVSGGRWGRFWEGQV